MINHSIGKTIPTGDGLSVVHITKFILLYNII